jgi:hypothetical protein
LFYRRSSLLAAGIALLTLIILPGAKGLTLKSEQDGARAGVVIEEVIFRHENDTLSGSLSPP